MIAAHVALRRALPTVAVALAAMLPTAAVASAQGQTDSVLAAQVPPDTHCYPLSLLCGFDMQVGPFGPFGPFEFLPGGSVFPPAPPPPPSAQTV